LIPVLKTNNAKDTRSIVVLS